MTDRKIVYWDCDDSSERLYHTEKDEAIESYLDMIPQKEWAGTMQVYGYARMEISVPQNGESVIDYVLESWDEELGDPEGVENITDAMRAAGDAFMAVMQTEYTVWACERVRVEDFDVMDWIREHRPDWLEEKALDKPD